MLGSSNVLAKFPFAVECALREPYELQKNV